MSDSMERLPEEQLEEVSGGKHHKKEYKTFDDVPGAIYVNELLEKHTGKHAKRCPECGNQQTWERYICIFDGDHVYPGRECPKCGKKWLTGDAMKH